MDPKDMNPEELKEFITNPNNYVKVSSYTKKLEDKIKELQEEIEDQLITINEQYTWEDVEEKADELCSSVIIDAVNDNECEPGSIGLENYIKKLKEENVKLWKNLNDEDWYMTHHKVQKVFDENKKLKDEIKEQRSQHLGQIREAHDAVKKLNEINKELIDDNTQQGKIIHTQDGLFMEAKEEIEKLKALNYPSVQEQIEDARRDAITDSVNRIGHHIKNAHNRIDKLKEENEKLKANQKVVVFDEEKGICQEIVDAMIDKTIKN